MQGYPLTRFQELVTLTVAEAEALSQMGEGARRYRRNAIIRRDRTPMESVYVLIEGWATSAVRMPNGQRQIVKVYIPGDMVGTPSMALEITADTLTALTDCVVAEVSLLWLRDLFIAHPRMAAVFLMAAQFERVALMDSMAAVGKSSARERLARLFIDLRDRLNKAGMADDNVFDLPLTQEQLGDVLGLTAVHVNRTMRLLEREGLIERRGHRIALINLAALRELSPLPPRRLRSDPPWLPAP